MLGHVLFCIPYSVTVLNAGFEGFDRSLEEASADLGESAFGTFRRVTLPMVAPAIISSLLVSFTISLDEFIMAFFLAGTEVTLPVYIWAQLRFAGRLPGVLALGTRASGRLLHPSHHRRDLPPPGGAARPRDGSCPCLNHQQPKRGR